MSRRPTHFSRCALEFDPFHRHIPTRPHPAIASTRFALPLMTKKRSQAHKSMAMCGLRATAQAQLQPTRTDRACTRTSSSTWRHHTAAAAVAVMLCFISMVAAQPGQCPAAWTTAALSVARNFLAATSLPNQDFAIFAGGDANGTYFIFFEILILRYGVIWESVTSGGMCCAEGGAL